MAWRTPLHKALFRRKCMFTYSVVLRIQDQGDATGADRYECRHIRALDYLQDLILTAKLLILLDAIPYF